MISVSGSRAYLDVKELKEILKLDGSTHLNIFFANSSDEDLAGVATWPWDKEALTHLGIEKLLHKHSPGQEFEMRSRSHLMLKISLSQSIPIPIPIPFQWFLLPRLSVCSS